MVLSFCYFWHSKDSERKQYPPLAEFIEGSQVKHAANSVDNAAGSKRGPQRLFWVYARDENLPSYVGIIS